MLTLPTTEPTVVRLAGSHGWIRSYVEWARQQTAAYEEYHLGTALAILSGAIGHRVTFYAWQKEFTPNLYILLLGPSGSKKSHALDFGKRVYKGATREQPLPTSVTKAALLEQFKGDPEKGIEPRKSAMWFHSELAVFLSTLNQEFNAGLRETLTSLYDGDEIGSMTKSSGLTIIKPSLSILAASNVEWLVRSISASDVMGGFLPRWTFFPGATEGAEPAKFWEKPTEFTHLGNELERTIEPVVWGDGKKIVNYGSVTGLMTEWMTEHRKVVKAAARVNPQLVPFYERWETLFIKLCVLYQVSLGKSITLSAEAVTCAAELATYLRVRFESMVLDSLAFDRHGRAQVALKQYLAAHGPTDGKVLRRALKGNFPTAKDFNTAVETLRASGEVACNGGVFSIDDGSDDMDAWRTPRPSTTR